MMMQARWLLVVLLTKTLAFSQEIIPVQRFETDANGRAVFTVNSSKDKYYLLQVRNSPAENFSHFTAMALGDDGTTRIVEPAAALPETNYRVWAFPQASPGDADNDGTDDMREFSNPIYRSPFNTARPLDFSDGAGSIPNHLTYKKLSYQGEETGLDPHLNGLEFVKFYIFGSEPGQSAIYFMNSENYRSHAAFKTNLQLNQQSGKLPLEMRGELIYHPSVISPNGTPGVYRFQFQPSDDFPFTYVQHAYELLVANLPFLTNNLAYYPLSAAAVKRYSQEKDRYDASRVTVLLENDIYADVNYLALHQAEGYGLLRDLLPEEIPGPREIALYAQLPNDMPRTGGIITSVPQTPLSHVNLRAIQDNVPNAFIRDAAKHAAIQPLIGRYVHYVVKQQQFLLEETSVEQVNAWYEALRPTEPQSPPLNLAEKTPLPLSKISFERSDAFGVKCANVATMRTFGFPEGTIPDGYGIPFYFYRKFMEFNGFDDEIKAFLADSSFTQDAVVRAEMLKAFRKKIEKAPMPDWMMTQLDSLHRLFPAGTSVRCRSSTNNEDLPNFSGAGLYDSKTHHPDEGHFSKTVKEVFASMWNFRAFEEREFFRVNHFAAAMGVLCHPNFSDEKVNGVGVSTDPLYHTSGTFYLNNQIGEDLVTNPEANSVPEEILLDILPETEDDYAVVRYAGSANGQLLFGEQYMPQMRQYLTIIHNRFKTLYGQQDNPKFAIEIEYKITKEGQLSIKQARPWAGENTNEGTGYIQEASPRPSDETDFRIEMSAYPNPFRTEVTLSYVLPFDGDVDVQIYTIHGQLLYTRSEGWQRKGNHRLLIADNQLINGGLPLFLHLILTDDIGSIARVLRLIPMH